MLPNPFFSFRIFTPSNKVPNKPINIKIVLFFVMENKKPLIIVLILALLLAGFFAFKSVSANKAAEADAARVEELELALQEKDRLAQQEASKAALADEARRLAEAKSAKDAQGEKARLAEIASLKAKENQARIAAQQARAAAEKETARLTAESQRLEAESKRLQALRQSEKAGAAAKLKMAEDALAKAKVQNRRDIVAARDEARKQAIKEMEARAAAKGQMAMTEVVSKERAEYKSSTPKIFIQKTNTNRLQPSYILQSN